MKVSTRFLSCTFMILSKSTTNCIALSLGNGSSKVQTRSTPSTGAPNTFIPSPIHSLSSFDYLTNDKLPWIQEGYGTWKWRDNDINYLEMGDPDKPALLLIHGFGASSYHFRYNIPILARDYHVFAFDLLGFGLSSKPIQEYSASVWRDQAADFITEVIRKPTTIAGNSLGGFTALYTAQTERVKSLITGCILLNAAGRFKDPEAEEIIEKNGFIKAIKNILQRLIIGASFIVTKQPARIEQILRQVYPINADNVDEELVESIRYPSLDPNAAEVFYRVIVKNGAGPQKYIDDLLSNLDCPLMLCWGEQDPWIRPQAADRIMLLSDSLELCCERVSVNAGHCPHDEAPDDVNFVISEFINKHKVAVV